jgi:large-conductance mechanosensitive channel
MKVFNAFTWTLIAIAVAFTTVNAASAAETKKACVTQKDPKTGKEKEVCKEIKVHKKLDGTPVPEKK